MESNITQRRLLRWPAVHERTGKSRAQAWRDIRGGKFPSPISTGPNSVAWFEDEIAAWQASRPRASYAPVDGGGHDKAA